MAGDPFEALGDPNRREILRLLGEGDRPVQELAAAMPISRPAVSRHLRLLKDAGLVTERAEGTRRIYHLQEPGLDAVQAYLVQVWGEAAARFRLVAENTTANTTENTTGNTTQADPHVNAPLRLAFEVACPPDHAFRVWTSGIDVWWPRDHTVAGGAGGLQIVLQDRVGGRIFERTTDGVEHDWGEVTVWEPPQRLGYRWHLGQDADDATDVDIRFVPDGADRTRVEIEHRGWDRLGARAGALRERNLGGWSSLLPHYLAAVTGAGRRPDGPVTT